MELSKAQQDIKHEYDTKIFDLQKDIKELERQFGFNREEVLLQSNNNPQNEGKSKKKVTISQVPFKRNVEQDDGEEEQPQLMRPTPMPMNTTKYLNQKPKQTRYTNLVSIKQEQPKMAKNNPEISERWPELFAQKPDKMRFYDKDEFAPIDFNKRDFQTNIHLQKENDVFNEYMDTFALTNL